MPKQVLNPPLNSPLRVLVVDAPEGVRPVFTGPELSVQLRGQRGLSLSLEPFPFFDVIPTAMRRFGITAKQLALSETRLFMMSLA